MVEGLLFPRDAVANIRAALDEFGDAWAELPSNEHLSKMLDVAFFASLEQEEGQPISVALGFAPRDEKHARGIQALAQPTPLTVREIRKLSPAVDPWRSWIAIEPNVSGELEIWGLVLGGCRRYEPLGGGGVPAQLIVRATGPGVIAVELHGRIIWFYDRGQADEPTHVVRTISILARAFPTALGNWRSIVLVWLARRLAEAGHGGTLAVVDRDHLAYLEIPPTRKFSRSRDSLRVCYERYDAAREAQTNFMTEPSEQGETPRRFEPDEKHQAVNRLAAELDAVAKLASVDGAVVLDRDSFAVVGFGSMFVTEKKPIKIVQATPAGEDLAPVQLSSLGGARHQSAARWCDEYGPTGFAIVVSQDGAGSFIRQVGDTVLVIRPLQLGSEDEGVLGDVADYPEPTHPEEFFGPLVSPSA